ncbi:nitrous oxide reductase accessory protein NosL [Hydrogenimonas urashimensis]|uniref:nitrous oxide reductase accessory protein NosL n=1 Tax=Hydrogenimonas urashimensis TaxID=2740515 RepID=UPI0019156ED4|nr:nitrous oxide reductase accessory protein NosL [Hydrogenimonas urashimensis]
MKRLIAALLLGIGLFVYADAAAFGKMATKKPELIQQGPQKMWCSVCGMNLKMFYKTSHAVILEDGTKKQYCSIRCLAADWPNISQKVKKILVVDAATEKLIDAKRAHYVVGSKVKGTMSMTSKIAFGSLEDARDFQRKFGGKIVDFDEAFAMARESLAKDSMMIAKKKEKKMYPMGERIYKKMCRPVDVSKYARINELKAAIKTEKLCKPMKEKQLQAVALYLWDIKGGHVPASPERTAKHHGKNEGNMPEVGREEKCPVCGMFVYKHPKWAAFIYYEKNGRLAHLAFDGVKDMMKFYFNPGKWGDYGDIKKHIKKIVVRDYYTLKPVWAKEAWYVVGSDVYGPMGNELIPFKEKKAAENFMRDHHGKKLLRFDQITQELVYKLDE